MSREQLQHQLEAGIAALQAQRALLGDAVVDTALVGLRAQLAGLQGAASAALEPTQTLKQVSILFLDVVGSTALSQHLDPEEISAVLDGALRRGTAIVSAHQGKVLQYAGDNLLAAFGADQSREDDAERAVRCGLKLLELGRVLGAEVQAAHHHAGFNVRIGIHTGGVLLGGGVDAEGSIRGIAVNIAARMEQAAPAGSLRIGHDTYAQVRGLFDVQALDPVSVKGVDEPVRSYLVQRAKPRSFRIATRGIEGVATGMIGRDAELEQLRGAFKRVFAQRALVAVLVVAEAGLGKSRLLTEFESWSEDRPERFYIFRGRATPQTQGQPFGLLRDILAWRFEIADDDAIEAARLKLERGIVSLFAHDEPDLAEGHAHLLGHLIGIDWRESRHVRGILQDPKQIRNRAFHAAAQMFRRVSAGDGSPVVLEIEDLHWADNESLDFLNYLAEVNRDVPLFVLGLTRPTLFERRAASHSAQWWQQRIDLHPLEKGYSHDLANELLKKLPEVPAALRALIIGGAEGNPFYMEELVRMLIDRGAIQTGERWSLNAERLLAVRVPPTLTGVLQARLDGLPAPERQTLQGASVIGHVFWDQALNALVEQADLTLPALVQRELTLPRPDTAPDGLREYVFKHQLLHQVTYGTVLKRTRRELHGKLARWLAAQTGLRANDWLGAAAEHFEQAGEDADAAAFHARAAEHAAGRFAHEAALTHVGRALALLERLPEQPSHAVLRWRLHDARERTLDMQGEREQQGPDLDAMAQLAETLDDDGKRAHAAWRRSYRAMRTADWPACERSARAAASLAQRAGDDALRLLSLRLLGSALAHQGEREAGKALLQEALAESKTLGLKMQQAQCLNILSIIAGMQDDPVRKLELDSESLDLVREHGDRRIEAIGVGNLGVTWAELGNIAVARRDLEEGLRLLRANGDRALECGPLCALSNLARHEGDDSRALSLARQALETAVAVRARDRETEAGLRLGDAELALGRRTAAAQAYLRARALGREIDNAMQHDATAGLARVALAQADLPTALQEVEALLAHVAAGGSLEGASERVIALSCHQVLARADDPRAAQWLLRAHTKLQATATTISDAALRQMFMTRIPEHREIVALFLAQHLAQQTAGR